MSARQRERADFAVEEVKDARGDVLDYHKSTTQRGLMGIACCNPRATRMLLRCHQCGRLRLQVYTRTSLYNCTLILAIVQYSTVGPLLNRWHRCVRRTGRCWQSGGHFRRRWKTHARRLGARRAT